MGKETNGIRPLNVAPFGMGLQDNRQKACHLTVSSAQHDADASTDLTGAPDSCGSSKGHRQNDIWHLEKRSLARKRPSSSIAITAQSAKHIEMHGKPERMKRHIVHCKKADHADQLHTLHKQAGSIASESGSQPQNESLMDRHIDRHPSAKAHVAMPAGQSFHHGRLGISHRR